MTKNKVNRHLHGMTLFVEGIINNGKEYGRNWGWCDIEITDEQVERACSTIVDNLRNDGYTVEINDSYLPYRKLTIRWEQT